MLVFGSQFTWKAKKADFMQIPVLDNCFFQSSSFWRISFSHPFTLLQWVILWRLELGVTAARPCHHSSLRFPGWLPQLQRWQCFSDIRSGSSPGVAKDSCAEESSSPDFERVGTVGCGRGRRAEQPQGAPARLSLWKEAVQWWLLEQSWVGRSCRCPQEGGSTLELSLACAYK